jgi:hypothetical protein
MMFSNFNGFVALSEDLKTNLSTVRDGVKMSNN